MTGAGQRAELDRTDEDQSPDFFSDGSLRAGSAPGAASPFGAPAAPSVPLTAYVTVTSVDATRRNSYREMCQVTRLPCTSALRFASFTGPGRFAVSWMPGRPSSFTSLVGLGLLMTSLMCSTSPSRVRVSSCTCLKPSAVESLVTSSKATWTTAVLLGFGVNDLSVTCGELHRAFSASTLAFGRTAYVISAVPDPSAFRVTSAVKQPTAKIASKASIAAVAERRTTRTPA